MNLRATTRLFLIIALSTAAGTAAAQHSWYLKGSVGGRHLYIPGEELKTNNSPLYSAGLGYGYRRIGLELDGFFARYTSDGLAYRFTDSNFSTTMQPYERSFTRKGVRLSLSYRLPLGDRVNLWLLAGGAYFRFDPTLQSADPAVTEEIQSFDRSWEAYSKLIPTAAVRVSYRPLPYVHLFAEGSYNLTLASAGLIVGNLGRAGAIEPPRAENAYEPAAKPARKRLALKFRNGRFPDIKWDVAAVLGNQLFPSFLNAAQRYDQLHQTHTASVFAFHIRSRKKAVTMRWEVECSDPAVCAVQSGLVQCDAPGENGFFYPPLTWNLAELIRSDGERQVQLRFRLIDTASGNRTEQTMELGVHRGTDWMTGYNGARYDSLIVSLVDNSGLETAKLLRQVQQAKLYSEAKDYAANTAAMKTAAVWKTLTENEFRFYPPYRMTDAERGTTFLSVRAPSDLASERAGNTAEGAVLVAGLLQACALNPVIVSIDSNYYPGYYTGADSAIVLLDLTQMQDQTFTASAKSTIEKGKDKLPALKRGRKWTDAEKAMYLGMREAAAQANNRLREAREQGTPVQLWDVGALLPQFRKMKG